MAQQCPNSVDVQNIQFKVHDKFNVFNGSAGDQANRRSHVNLLATASNYGLMFVGNANQPELKVILLRDVADCKSSGKKLHARQVQLPNLPNAIAVSSDGTMLAVNYTQNGSGFLQIYSVPSFTAANIKSLANIRLSADENVYATQLLWNPVISNNLAVVLSNGALGMYTLKDGGNVEYKSLDKQHQVKCGCWSPKGKQIVLGFSGGKLMQFKPDLSPAKTIACPANIHSGPFDTIAVHWLSTFQFAVIFLQQGDDMTPSLYIINAPKAGAPNYILYYDVCYSVTGLRQHQFTFTHIQPWNLLLISSANGVEVGILGTNESGEAPSWIQYMMLDEARIEMPLTEDKDETYPIGFSLDTSSTHQLTIAEQKIPIMPMVHILSTHGHLVSFNFLNLSTGAPDICSPPNPISDTSGMSQFRTLDDILGVMNKNLEIAAQTTAAQKPSDTSFAFTPPGVTSTPTLKEQTNEFGFGSRISDSSAAQLHRQFATAPNIAPAPQTASFKPPGNMHSEFSLGANGQQAKAAQMPPASTVPMGIGGYGQTNAAHFSGFGSQLGETTQPVPATTLPIAANRSQPLYTIPPTFTPPAAPASDVNKIQHVAHTQSQAIVKPQINSTEMDEIVRQMITVKINSFDLELRQLSNQSKGLLSSIGSPNEMKSYTKRLNDLQEICDQANDREFEVDVQSLRHSLSESYAMLAECRSKMEMFKNPDIARLTSTSSYDLTNRRQLAKLHSYVATNQTQLQQLQQQIDAQWSNYQDLVHRNSRAKMHTPCLEGVYQRMTKLKDLIAKQRTKLNYIKSKLRQKGLLNNNNNLLNSNHKSSGKADVTMESLADSILSMSLVNIVNANQSKLSDEKLNAIRQIVNGRKIAIIKPQRPSRVGLKSEVILETKLQTERNAREGAVTNIDKMEQERIIKTNDTRVLTKPTATKAVARSAAAQQFSAPSSQSNVSMGLSFGGASPFVKTSSSTKIADEQIKPTQQYQQQPIDSPFIVGSGGNSFAPNTTSGALSFAGLGRNGQTKAATQTAGSAQTLVSKTDAPKATAPHVPISFSPKVIGGDTKSINTSASAPFSAMNVPNVKPPLAQSFSTQEKENKKPEEPTFQKEFGKAAQDAKPKQGEKPMFGGNSSGANLFGGFTLGGASGGGSATKPKLFDTKLPTTGFSFAGISTSDADTSTAENAAASTLLNLSFGGPESLAATTPTATTKAAAFSGFGKSTETGDDASGGFRLGSSATPSTPTTGFNFGNLSFTATSAPAAAAVTSTESVATDPLFGTLNICKPTAQENNSSKPAKPDGNIFAGFGGSGDGINTSDVTKSIFGNSSSTFSFGALSSEGTSASDIKRVFGDSAAAAPVGTSKSKLETVAKSSASVATSNTTTTTQSSAFSFAAKDSAAGVQSTPASTPVFGTATTTANASIFGTSSTNTTIASSVVTTTAASSASIFGGTPSFLSATPVASSPSIFGGSAASPVATTSASSIFAAAAAATAVPVSSSGGSIFSGIPKPEQSVFGSPTAAATVTTASSGGGLFANAAAVTSPFGAPTGTPAASGGSLFGGSGGGGGFAATAASGGSIFGGSTTNTSPFGATPSTAGGSIFGSPKPADTGTSAAGGTNIFGSPPASSATGGSIFGQSAFGQAGQSTGSIFGAAATNQAPAFGSGGSIFANAAANVTNSASASGSIFGGGNAANTSAFCSPSTFGSFSAANQPSAFGSPGPGSFAQGGPSIAQSGFGSPSSAQSSFAKPLFGPAAASVAAPAFGSPPTFGSPPSFGGGPTFGSPKGFGSFVSPTAAAIGSSAGGAFSPPTQQSNLFEALGSSETGLSFGNLAQNTNANAAKPSFGGSSFMNYRS